MGERTWPNLLAALLRGEELVHRRHRLGDGRDHGRRRPRRCRSPAFAVALRAKGETAGRDRRPGRGDARPTPYRCRAAERVCARDAVDVVGTGGDRAHTVNISTMAAIVVAGAGRHGWSSTATGPPPRSCGTADLLEYLGIPLDLRPGRGGPLRRRGRHRVLLRRPVPPGHAARRGRPGASWACPTVFNFLGPLTNPARPPGRRGRLRRPADGAGDGRGVRRAAATRCW